METDKGLHHILRFPHGTELIVITLPILLQEIILEEPSNIQGDLARIAKR